MRLAAIVPCDAFAAMLAVLALFVATSGCEPTVTVQPEGMVARGRFTRLALAGSPDGSAYVLALRDADAEGGVLVVAPFHGGPACEIGRVRSYYTAPWALEPPPVQPRVVCWAAGTSPLTETLRFADLSCRAHGPALEDVASPLAVYGLAREGEGPLLAVLTGSGELHVLDPWSETGQRIAGGVTQLAVDRATQAALWLVEGGQVVVRDRAGVELGRFGSNVTGLDLDFDGSPPALSEVAYADDEGLHALDGLSGTPTLLEAGACEPEYSSWWSSALLAYKSPCADRALVVLDRETGERRVFGSGAGEMREIYAGPGAENWIAYVSGPPGTTTVGELWVVPPGASSIRVAADACLDCMDLVMIDGRILVFADLDGETWRFGVWNQASGFTELDRGVAWWDFGAGAVAVLADYDGGVGNLRVYERGGLTLQAQAASVPKGGFRFASGTSGIQALGYVDEWDAVAGAGRFRVRVLSPAQTLDVDRDVSEFLELRWPERGALYSIPYGSRAGIWFASVDVDW